MTNISLRKRGGGIRRKVLSKALLGTDSALLGTRSGLRTRSLVLWEILICKYLFTACVTQSSNGTSSRSAMDPLDRIDKATDEFNKGRRFSNLAEIQSINAHVSRFILLNYMYSYYHVGDEVGPVHRCK